MANRFWVSGTGTWNGATTHWSTTSGGSSGAAAPTSSDDAFFDANSGSVSVLVSSATLAVCHSLDFTGFTGTLSITVTGEIHIFGSLNFSSGMTLVLGANGLSFESTSTGNTITTNGKSIACKIVFNGLGGSWLLQDDFTFTGTVGNFLTTNGTFDANGHNVTASSFGTSSPGTVGINLGSGLWTITGSGTVWNLSVSTGVTLNGGTSTIKFTDSSSNAKNFFGCSTTDGLVYNNLWFTGSGTGNFGISGNFTCNDFKVDTPPHTVIFGPSVKTVSTFTVNGTAGNLITLKSSVVGTQFNLAKAGGGVINSDFLSIIDSGVTPPGTWFAGDNSLNGGNNTGWNFYSSTALVNARKDDNGYPTMFGVSCTDGVTPVRITFNPATKAMLIDTTTVISITPTNFNIMDANDNPVRKGVSSADGVTLLPWYVNPATGAVLAEM